MLIIIFMHRPRFLLHIVLIVVFLTACSGSPINPAGGYTVIIHPDGVLYVGDQVSFEVRGPASVETSDHQVAVSFSGEELGSANFAPFGVGGRSEAIFWWIWDTRGLKPGSYSMTFTSQPDDIRWTETVSLHPASQIPPAEQQAHWSENVTTCCDIFYIVGTEAARDIQNLDRIADEQSASVAGQLHTIMYDKIQLIFMPRVLGQGGFTNTGVYISYLDRNYIDNNDLDIVLHHEFVHVYDNFLGGTYRLAIFEEGLAVYLTGGHFKPEPIGPRAAALLDLGLYIPLQTLADDFYNQQHEIGYIEAAGLVKFLVETYGWDAFNRFYRSIPGPQGSDSREAIDTSLRKNLGISFNDMETDYRNFLKSQPVTEAERQDLQMTIQYFDTVRRYQQDFDPSAYFLTTWLPDGAAMRQRGIVADLLRHPTGWENRYLETQLVQAWTELAKSDYASAGRRLDWVNSLMDILAP